jgi:hypothetical protein
MFSLNEYVQEHDELSGHLNQLSYGGIKAKAEQNRQAFANRKSATG